jgi:hypothetical protein
VHFAFIAARTAKFRTPDAQVVIGFEHYEIRPHGD